MQELEVVIDVPLGSFIKRDDRGLVDYMSPLPCPFNYGSVPGTVSGDGDRIDALVLGPRLEKGARVQATVRAVVRFTDAGASDPKYVCSRFPLTRRQRVAVVSFFGLYAFFKSALNALRGLPGPTRYEGIHEP